MKHQLNNSTFTVLFPAMFWLAHIGKNTTCLYKCTTRIYPHRKSWRRSKNRETRDGMDKLKIMLPIKRDEKATSFYNGGNVLDTKNALVGYFWIQFWVITNRPFIPSERKLFWTYYCALPCRKSEIHPSNSIFLH